MTNIMFILSIDTMKEDIKKELDFCIELREKQGGCEFNKQTKCEQCAAMSVLRKLYSWEVLDGQKLSLEERQAKLR
jgi:hypothetical protein